MTLRAPPYDAAGRALTVTRPDPSPAPAYVLRGHSSQINTLAFSQTGPYILSGDSDGFLACWSLETFRPILFARVHAASVLTVIPWHDNVVTHGRDNKIHVFRFPSSSRLNEDTSPAPSPDRPDILSPTLTVEVNALGYCQCSLVPLSHQEALVAVPSVLNDQHADVFHIPSRSRRYKSIGANAFETKTGTVMSLRLHCLKGQEHTLRLLAGYEDGRVAMFERNAARQAGTDAAHDHVQDGEGWVKICEHKLHKEPVMSLSIQMDLKFAWSVSADNMVGRYDLSNDTSRAYQTAYPGRACVAIRDDSRILAITGWDGKIRIHSAKTFKPLAVLEYHRDSVFTAAFATTANTPSEISVNTRSPGLLPDAHAWCAFAGSDQRISLWSLYPDNSS